MNDDSQRVLHSDDPAARDGVPRGRSYRRPLVLFLITVVSVFSAGVPFGESGNPRAWLEAWIFAVPLLAILLTHEFGHFIAAVLHGVPASLPYFIPMPIGLFGTLGAVIGMRDRIRSRNALLDIGAAGPLAGLVMALPLLAVGLSLSEVKPLGSGPYIQEGQSLLYLLMKQIFVGPIPVGSDVELHPTALAGWAGLFITMINLLPWGQLDGGHIAFALFGERQHAFARWLRRALLLLFAYNLALFVLPIFRGTSTMPYSQAIGNSMFWLVWFGVTALLAFLSQGADHPPFDGGTLSRGRRRVAWLCLALFVVLFMPTPIATY